MEKVGDGEGIEMENRDEEKLRLHEIAMGNGEEKELRLIGEEGDLNLASSGRRRSSRKASAEAKQKRAWLVGYESEEERPRKGKRKASQGESSGAGNVASGVKVLEEPGKRNKGRKPSVKKPVEEIVVVEASEDGSFSPKTTGNGREKKMTRNKFDENGNKIERTTCHQCKRNDKGEVVRCTNCYSKRYCFICINKWCVMPYDSAVSSITVVCYGFSIILIACLAFSVE